MTSIPTSGFSTMGPAQLRLAETMYLFDRFKDARNAHPNHGLFLLTVYFDSFLFCLISIEEMVDDETRSKLRSLDSFMFFKALRNITTHHSVLSGIKGKFERPISRLVSIGFGCDVDFGEQFFIVPEKLEEIFAKIVLERPQQKRTIDRARRYLSRLRMTGEKIMIANVIESVVSDVEPHVT